MERATQVRLICEFISQLIWSFLLLQLEVLSTATATAQVNSITNGPASSPIKSFASVPVSVLVRLSSATTSTISWVVTG